MAVPTVDHHRVARALLEAGKHVLVEKPMCSTVAEAEDLIALAGSRGLVLQVGHVERFNPAVDVLRANAVGRGSSRSTGWPRSRPGASTWTSSST